MTAAEFAKSISSFGTLSYADQIRFFCWYLTIHAKMEAFSGTDLLKCFDDAQCPRPSAMGPFLASLINCKPAFLLKRSNRYCLSLNGKQRVEKSLGTKESTVTVDALLAALPAKLSVDCERAYLEEALICFRHGAFRATIVMAWNVAYDHLCNVILTTHLIAFNTQLPKSYPKADIAVILKRDDFELLKESQVIQVAKSANIISGSVHKIMKEKLDRRNIAAHPSGVAIAQVTAEDVIIDLIQNVVLKV